MEQVFDRYDRLVRQREALEGAGALLRPALVVYSADVKLLAATRRAFSPAIPLTAAGLIYAALGAALVLAGRGAAGWLRRMFRRLRSASDL